MKIVFKLGPRPPPPPPRDYSADEICAAESLLMLSQSIPPSSSSSSNPSAANKSTPATATPATATPSVKKTQDWSLLPPLASKLPYVCDVCGDAFKSYQALGGHKTRHRPKSKTATVALSVSDGTINNDGVHECSDCQERFSSGQALGGHKRKHYEGIIGGPSKRVKTGSPGRDSSGLAVIEDDDRSHASTDKLPGLDLNLPCTHNFFD